MHFQGDDKRVIDLVGGRTGSHCSLPDCINAVFR